MAGRCFSCQRHSRNPPPRVVVDTHGLPSLVQVQCSSGHARLDEQAAWGMRQARFKPHTGNGARIEFEVIAPIECLLDRKRLHIEPCALVSCPDSDGVTPHAAGGAAHWHLRQAARMLAWPVALAPDNHAVALGAPV